MDLDLQAWQKLDLLAALLGSNASESINLLNYMFLFSSTNYFILQQCSGFIDIDKINPDAWPALIADLSAGEQGIIALAFEELARIEVESIAEKAVAAHTALVEQVEKDLNAKFEKDLLLEMEKITTVEKMAKDVKQALKSLKAEREKENIKLMEERAVVDSKMEVFSKLRHEVEEQLSSIMSSKVEILHEKERLNKLLTYVEIENEEIAKLQHELEFEHKALSMARSWAEDEAKRTREQAKVLEEARDHWKSQGIKIVVDQDLHEDANAGATWLRAGDQLSIEGTKSRAQNLVDKLKPMTANLKGKSREIINSIIQKVLNFISQLTEWTSKAGKQVEEVKVKLTHKFKT
ncbi:hypothetical protein CTI12_AA034220 [Artemisia annua]|uniref:Uncharacterized protein n=1 Tax=Artemisia annua TaxID=35608 RepID=A0A2U1QG23_ARTAN|nr:hypothetical protein CTI12_AA034220 [Artemisia annua]